VRISRGKVPGSVSHQPYQIHTFGQCRKPVIIITLSVWIDEHDPHIRRAQETKMKDQKKRRVMILSIDGGGIRGLIPAMVLRELEGRLRDCTDGKPFSEVFDLIAGTSTGSLITMGLTLPKRYPHRPNAYLNEPAMSVGEITDFYLRRGTEVFPQDALNGLRTLAHVFREKYDVKRLERMLEEILGSATLKDCLTNVLVTAYDTERGKPFLFKNGSLESYAENSSFGGNLGKVKQMFSRRNPSGFGIGERDLNFALKDVARAATAAPTYFPPAKISPVPYNGESYCLIDGGVFAVNPSLCAYVEAKKLFPKAKEFIVLSLGTGNLERRYSYNELKDWGYMEWMSPVKKAPLPNIMMKSQSQIIDYQMRSFPDVRYYRFNVSLENCNDEMDDASRQNIGKLQKAAERIMKKHDTDIDDFCRLIAA
jgi:patatin-like phospholipase/acyl hydrolase